MKEIKAAIKVILENKGCVVFDTTNGAVKTGSWQVWGSSSGYTILHFNGKSDLMRDDEQHFETIEDAVNAFAGKISRKVKGETV